MKKQNIAARWSLIAAPKDMERAEHAVLGDYSNHWSSPEYALCDSDDPPDMIERRIDIYWNVNGSWWDNRPPGGACNSTTSAGVTYFPGVRDEGQNGFPGARSFTVRTRASEFTLGLPAGYTAWEQ